MGQITQGSGEYARRVRLAMAEREKPELIDIENLFEWTYAIEKPHKIELCNDEQRHFQMRCSVNALAAVRELGTSVDGSRGARDPHEDAIAVHEALMRFAQCGDDAAIAAGYVMMFAATRSRPIDPVEYKLPRPKPLLVNGRIRMTYGDTMDNRSYERSNARVPRPKGYVETQYRVGQACEVDWRGVYEELNDLRKYQFGWWVGALKVLHPTIPPLKKFILKRYQEPRYCRPKVFN